jgi:hypothetical protein
MSNEMEWILIFFIFYVFASVWLISSMLETIIKMLKEMNEKK